MLPGRPLAMMSFKTYGYIAMLQGVVYAQDLKLGNFSESYVILSGPDILRSLHEGSAPYTLFRAGFCLALELYCSSRGLILGIWIDQ
jgi:OPT oligopeptide transporter protein